MKHCIIVKWNEKVNDKAEMLNKVKDAFNGIENIDGCSNLEVIPNCTKKENRYDVMIRFVCDEEGLELYDKSQLHQNWKLSYSQYIEKKAIFDYK